MGGIVSPKRFDCVLLASRGRRTGFSTIEELCETVDENELIFEQGHFLDRPGRVRVRIEDEIRVGGRATVSLYGTLTVPDIENGGIIET